MAEPQMVDPHDVVMTGENSFIRLSSDGGKTIPDRVSHWRVLWSPAGQGHSLFIEFTRSGNSLSTVEERIVSSKDEIILSWWDLMKPFVLTMPPGAMNRPLGVYSTFLPARSAQLSVNGEAAGAKPFPQERFGKPSSSCCLAWSESWTRPRG